MSYDYNTYVSYLQTMIASTAPDISFQTILPMIIDYAEQRIYRELDLLATNVADYSSSLTPNSRNASVSNNYVVVDAINVLTPLGAGNANGTRNPLVPVQKEVINTLWPSNTATSTPSIPTMFAMIDQWDILVAPPPDTNYTLEVIGTQRPVPLSATNTSTFLTDRLPDLFMAASMIFASGYMRNFGSQASDPAMSASWETQYEALLKSAEVEEARKYKWASSWTSYPVSPAAQPQRG